MIWGCFGSSAVGDNVKIQGILNAEGYKDILQNHVVLSGIRLIGPFVFKHDNNLKYTSKLCKQFLEAKENQNILKVMQVQTGKYRNVLLLNNTYENNKKINVLYRYSNVTT